MAMIDDKIAVMRIGEGTGDRRIHAVCVIDNDERVLLAFSSLAQIAEYLKCTVERVRDALISYDIFDDIGFRIEVKTVLKSSLHTKSNRRNKIDWTILLSPYFDKGMSIREVGMVVGLTFDQLYKPITRYNWNSAFRSVQSPYKDDNEWFILLSPYFDKGMSIREVSEKFNESLATVNGKISKLRLTDKFETITPRRTQDEWMTILSPYFDRNMTRDDIAKIVGVDRSTIIAVLITLKIQDRFNIVANDKDAWNVIFDKYKGLPTSTIVKEEGLTRSSINKALLKYDQAKRIIRGK